MAELRGTLVDKRTNALLELGLLHPFDELPFLRAKLFLEGRLQRSIEKRLGAGIGARRSRGKPPGQLGNRRLEL